MALAASDRKAALNRARKFRALALDPAAAETAEASNAQAAFDRLVEKFSISESELLAEEITVVRMSREGPGVWRTFFLSILATWFDCNATHNIQSGNSSLYGDKQGIENTQDAYGYVLGWILDRCAEWKEMYAGWDLAGDDDFCMTVTVALHRRMKAMKAGQEHDPFAYDEQEKRENPLAKVNGQNTALDIDRKDLRKEAERRARMKPSADKAAFQFEYVPQGEMVAQVIPWPPPPPEKRKRRPRPSGPDQIERPSPRLSYDSLLEFGDLVPRRRR
jgi:hypothetical protein